MLNALPIPAPALIQAAAARVAGSEKAAQALCKGLRVYARDGGFVVDSFTTDARYFVKDGVCTCAAYKHGRGGCKHVAVIAILELAYTLSQMDLVSYPCRGVGCTAVSAQPGLCPSCLRQPTMPKLKSKAQVESEMAALF